MIKKYNYYVSFSFEGGSGCCEVSLDDKITEIDQVLSIAKELENGKAKKVTIMNFVLLKEVQNEQ